jgi:hypothetical protein
MRVLSLRQYYDLYMEMQPATKAMHILQQIHSMTLKWLGSRQRHGRVKVATAYSYEMTYRKYFPWPTALL